MLPAIKNVKFDNIEYMLFDTNDLISRCLCQNGDWDKHILNILKQFYENEEAPIILDIGANFGTYTLPIAKNIQERGGTVISFEPQRIVYYQLCSNAILNRLDNCYLYNQAVGDYDGMIDLPDIDYNTIENIGAFSFSKEYREKHGIEKSMASTRSSVPIITLNSLEFFKPPALIKIDVEGYELNVIKGGINFLEKYNYPTLSFEAWNDDWFKTEKENLMQTIQNLGYEIYNVYNDDYIAKHPNKG
jgi:FkbM family methyltransferase